ncbi:MAG: hypothetical protein VST70_01130 [Nitrospirota bacterium]|nr:hypothetical protein [Nitrospirota bacterium]
MNLDSGTKRKFEEILNQKEKLKETQDNLKESVKELADEIAVKSAFVNRILGLVEKERAKPGVISDERDIVSAAGEVV